MDEREAFLKALQENEDDETTRLIYADWLEEHGEDDEAERQRKWSAAKKWLEDLCERANVHSYEDTTTYPWLMERIGDCIKYRDGYISCGDHQELSYVLQEHREEFWENWSIVTGIPVPLELQENTYFGCSC